MAWVAICPKCERFYVLPVWKEQLRCRADHTGFGHPSCVDPDGVSCKIVSMDKANILKPRRIREI